MNPNQQVPEREERSWWRRHRCNIVERLGEALAKLAGIDLVTTGTARTVVEIRNDVRDLKRDVAKVLQAESAQVEALGRIERELNELGLPQEQLQAVLAAVQRNVAKLRAVVPPPSPN